MTRITRRDISVLRDLALSHLLSRNQLLDLGYFGSINRVNARMRELVRLGLAKRLDTPFFNQSLYVVTKRAAEVVGERISPLIENRADSPRFIQHALATTNVRLALLHKTQGAWRFEQQLWRKLPFGSGRAIRPDGLLLTSSAKFIEVDMGHVNPKKFREKLLAYEELAQSGQCQDLYGFAEFKLLTLTTGKLRARHLNRLTDREAGFEHRVQTFAEIGVILTNSWS